MLMVGLVGLFWTNSTSDYFLTLYPLVGVQNIKKYGTAELTKMNLLLLLHFVSHLIKKTDVSAIHIEEKRRETALDIILSCVFSESAVLAH